MRHFCNSISSLSSSFAPYMVKVWCFPVRRVIGRPPPLSQEVTTPSLYPALYRSSSLPGSQVVRRNFRLVPSVMQLVRPKRRFAMNPHILTGGGRGQSADRGMALQGRNWGKSGSSVSHACECLFPAPLLFALPPPIFWKFSGRFI
jgi:hypothetical protein